MNNGNLENINNKHEDFLTFIDILSQAACEVANEYMSINFSGTEEEKFRERVYCYELYHQLRKKLLDHSLSKYKLHGEMDKRTHAAYSSNSLLKDTIPDFIVHRPRTMDYNLVVIEVKHCASRDIPQDITKLNEFVRVGKYYKGICYVFGVLSKQQEEKIAERQVENVYLVFHRSKDEFKVIPPRFNW